MPRTIGSTQLNDAERGYILGLKENSQLSNLQVARKAKCDEKTVRNVATRATEAIRKISTLYLQPLFSHALDEVDVHCFQKEIKGC